MKEITTTTASPPPTTTDGDFYRASSTMNSTCFTKGMYKLKIINAKSERDNRYVQIKNHKCKVKKRQ